MVEGFSLSSRYRPELRKYKGSMNPMVESNHSRIEAGRMIMIQMVDQQYRTKKLVFINAMHPTRKPVSKSLLLALFSLYIRINNLNTSSIMPLNTSETGLMGKGRSALSTKKDMAGSSPALSASLWSVMILLSNRASTSKIAVKMILPIMLLDGSRKERNEDNSLKKTVAPAGASEVTPQFPVIPGKEASKTSKRRAIGLLFLKIPITLLDQNSSFAKQI